MSLPYAVVTFLDEADFSDEDDDVTSEVPSTWLTPTKTHCWWPKTTDIKTYIAKRKPPVEGRRWSLCNIKFEGYFEHLDKARSVAADKRSESESSSNNSQSTNKRHLRKRKEQLSCVKEVPFDRDSPDSDDHTSSRIPEPPKLIPKQNVKTSAENSSLINSNESTVSIGVSESPRNSHQKKSNASSDSQIRIKVQSLPADFDIRSLPITLSSSPIHIRDNNSNLLSTTHRSESFPINFGIHDLDVNGTADSINNIKTTRDTYSKSNDTVHPSSNQSLGQTSLLFDGILTDLCNNAQDETKKIIEGHRENFKQVTGDLPFRTTVDIQMFEIKLADAALCSSFVKYVGQIGGNSAKENTIRILRQVFTNEVAKIASWCGLRANFQLSNLKVIAAIEDGVRLSYTCSDKDFEETVSEWFRQAKQRFERENEKKNPPPRSVTRPE